MKSILTIAAILIFTVSQANAHGGGCRKSSPAGQCCHKQTSTGQVHCH